MCLVLPLFFEIIEFGAFDLLSFSTSPVSCCLMMHPVLGLMHTLDTVKATCLRSLLIVWSFLNSLFSFCLPWSSTWYGRTTLMSILLATPMIPWNNNQRNPRQGNRWWRSGSNWKKDRLPRQNSSSQTPPEEDRSICYCAPRDDGFRIYRNAC